MIFVLLTAWDHHKPLTICIVLLGAPFLHEVGLDLELLRRRYASQRCVFLRKLLVFGWCGWLRWCLIWWPCTFEVWDIYTLVHKDRSLLLYWLVMIDGIGPEIAWSGTFFTIFLRSSPSPYYQQRTFLNGLWIWNPTLIVRIIVISLWSQDRRSWCPFEAFDIRSG